MGRGKSSDRHEWVEDLHGEESWAESDPEPRPNQLNLPRGGTSSHAFVDLSAVCDAWAGLRSALLAGWLGSGGLSARVRLTQYCKGNFIPLTKDKLGLGMEQRPREGDPSLQEVADSTDQGFISKSLKGVANGTITRPFNDTEESWAKKVEGAKSMTEGLEAGKKRFPLPIDPKRRKQHRMSK